MFGTLGLQIMYGAAVLGAGVVGAMTLFAPVLAGRNIFAGEAVVGAYVRILGALWMALGLVAILGLVRPSDFVPLLLIQLVYKVAWLLIVGYPTLAGGQRGPGLIFFVALFTAWVVALLFAIPFGDVLSGI